MKKLVIVLLVLTLSIKANSQQIVDSFIFPQGILATHFVTLGSDGEEIKGLETIEMFIQNNDKIVFERKTLFENNLTSKIRRTYKIKDSVIYLLDEKVTSAINGSNSFYYGDRNIYIKIPSTTRYTTKWETKEGETFYKCEATKKRVTNSVDTTESIIIVRTPIENKKPLTDFKTKLVFIKGKGLYKEVMVSTNKTLYVMNLQELIK